jgi:hypothetical protein
LEFSRNATLFKAPRVSRGHSFRLSGRMSWPGGLPNISVWMNPGKKKEKKGISSEGNETKETRQEQ